MLGRKHMPQCCIDRPIFAPFGDVLLSPVPAVGSSGRALLAYGY